LKLTYPSETDFIGSTSTLLKFTQESVANEFIVATEEGIIHQMLKKSPGKKFIPAPPDANCSCNECPYMKLNTMEKLYECMLEQKPEIILDEETRLKALRPIQKMLDMS